MIFILSQGKLKPMDSRQFLKMVANEQQNQDLNVGLWAPPHLYVSLCQNNKGVQRRETLVCGLVLQM